MKGLVITTQDFAEMAGEAAGRFTRFTGLPCGLQFCDDRAAAHRAKLELREDCWVIDADLWFCSHVGLPLLSPELLFATPAVPSPEAREVIRHWAASANIDPALWFSGGFFGACWSSLRGQLAASRAREHAAIAGITERDEEPLNVGAQRSGLAIALLPSAYNWHPVCGPLGYGYKPEPVAIHAGSVPAAEKLEFLRTHCPPLSN